MRILSLVCLQAFFFWGNLGSCLRWWFWRGLFFWAIFWRCGVRGTCDFSYRLFIGVGLYTMYIYICTGGI